MTKLYSKNDKDVKLIATMFVTLTIMYLIPVTVPHQLILVLYNTIIAVSSLGWILMVYDFIVNS